MTLPGDIGILILDVQDFLVLCILNDRRDIIKDRYTVTFLLPSVRFSLQKEHWSTQSGWMWNCRDRMQRLHACSMERRCETYHEQPQIQQSCHQGKEARWSSSQGTHSLGQQCLIEHLHRSSCPNPDVHQLQEKL